MNDSRRTRSGLRFLIAGYGVEGIVATTLIEHSEWFQSTKGSNDNITFIKLDTPTNTKRIHDMLAGVDMVFILGSDDDITAPPSALILAMQCKELGITCVTALTITAPPGQKDIATESLCNLSSHCLQFPDTQPVDNLNSCIRLLEAVQTIIGKQLGGSLSDFDLDDFRTVLK